MKKNFTSYFAASLLLSAFCLLPSSGAFAQNSFPTDNAKWNVRSIWWNMYDYYDFWEKRVRNMIYSIEGDTLINGILYNKLLYNGTFLGGFRQENQKVWFMMKNSGSWRR